MEVDQALEAAELVLAAAPETFVLYLFWTARARNFKSNANTMNAAGGNSPQNYNL